MQKKCDLIDNANIQHYFIYNQQKMGAGTKVQFNYDFYHRNSAHNYFGYYKYCKPNPSIFSHILCKGGKTIWYFNNCISDDLVPERDVEQIVEPFCHVEFTDKDRIRIKKEKGMTWDYIWLGTIIYIISMLFIAIFHERIFGWIAATIIYLNYCYEQLSR